jgi:uncharacterized protein (TIGR03437 family)
MFSAKLRFPGMLMLALAGPVSAQIAGPTAAAYTQLTATDDGQQIYFTSPLVLKSNSTSVTRPEGRLYRLGPDGVALVAERGSRAAFPIGGQGIFRPQVSADGTTLAYTLLDVCATARANPAIQCTPFGRQAIVQGKEQLELGEGTVELSRNGRWALLSPVANFTRQTATLVDFSTGRRTAVPAGPALGECPTLASDGTILVEERSEQGAGTHSFGLWKQGVVTPVAPDTDGLRAMALSDNARVLLFGATRFTQPFSGATKIAARNLQSDARTVLFSSGNESEMAVLLGISNDGLHVLYNKVPADGPFAGTAFVADTATGESLPIRLPSGEQIIDGTLSGSGDVAFLVTTSNRLVKVSITAGAVATLLPATPYARDVDGLVPGSLFLLRGSLSGDAAAWKGRILVDGKVVPVLHARTGEIAIQVPWEQKLGTAIFRLDPATDSPFQQVQAAVILEVAPINLAVIRGDWSGLLNRSPASGDIVHIYMAGLGPVTPPAETGILPSVLHAIDGKITCGFNGIENIFATDAETLWAGLAPGAIGAYQVSIRLPSESGTWGDLITCKVKTRSGAESLVIFGLTPP